MRKIIALTILTSLCFSLSGCFLFVAAGAGAGAGYVYKDQQDQKRKDEGKQP